MSVSIKSARWEAARRLRRELRLSQDRMAFWEAAADRAGAILSLDFGTELEPEARRGRLPLTEGEAFAADWAAVGHVLWKAIEAHR